MGAVVVACGRSDLTGSLGATSDDAGTASDDARTRARSSGTTATMDAGAMAEGGVTAAKTGGAPAETCVDIDVSTYDQSCTKSDDCLAIASQTQCNWGCLCPDAAVNVSGQARYEQATGALPDLGDCGCPATRYACCVDDRCVTSLSSCADSLSPVDGGTD
jgi:hypothetical protein